MSVQTVYSDVPVPWRIVFIDENDEDRAEVRRLLLRGSERRYTFVEAQTGAAGIALVLLKGALPDCVVLDYNLSDMNALDVLAALVRPDGLLICPVVVLTGGAGPMARRAVLRAGAQDYIGKDWLAPTGLTWVVENAIERLAMARQLLLRDEALRRNEKALAEADRRKDEFIALLAEADRRKDEFIAMLAHELRNPLAPVRTGAQVLRMTDDAHTKCKTLDMIDRQLGQMARLIDDLLDVSRITNSKVLLRLERVSVHAVAKAAVEAARPAMDAGSHQLVINLPDEDAWLDADPTRLAQVIGNLLNNSAKYSQEKGRITLSFLCEADQVVIQVEDTGFGIPEAMLENVFDMFTQIRHTFDHAQGGLGIGLALVKRLVEMHNGTVIAESAGTDCGSTFIIRLPRAAATACAADTVQDFPLDAAVIGRRILVVDDNVDGATTLAMMLDFCGHDTRTAFTGCEALKIAEDFKPEVVFLDIGLPDMNGYEVARRFRANPRLRDAVLVALTGWGSHEDRSRSRKAGFDEHLTKPVEPAVLEALLARFDTLTLHETQPMALEPLR